MLMSMPGRVLKGSALEKRRNADASVPEVDSKPESGMLHRRIAECLVHGARKQRSKKAIEDFSRSTARTRP